MTIKEKEQLLDTLIKKYQGKAEESDKKAELLIQKMQTRLEEIIKVQNRLIAKAIKLDSLYLVDLSKLYGFDKTEMYYIGAASGHVYRKPIDKRIVEMIGNIKRCTDEHKREINCHFMDLTYKPL